MNDLAIILGSLGLLAAPFLFYYELKQLKKKWDSEDGKDKQ